MTKEGKRLTLVRARARGLEKMMSDSWDSETKRGFNYWKYRAEEFADWADWLVEMKTLLESAEHERTELENAQRNNP